LRGNPHEAEVQGEKRGLTLYPDTRRTSRGVDGTGALWGERKDWVPL